MSNVKEQLLETATRLFSKHGYANTSVAQICAEAGVSKGALYHHYKSKDAILYGIYQPLLELQIDSLQEIIKQPTPIVDRLFMVAEDVGRTCLERIDELTVFIQSMHLLEPETRSLVSRQRRHYHQILSDLIKEAQRQQVLRADVHPDFLINQLFGPVHYSTTWYRKSGKATPNELARQMASMWLNGIQPASTTE
jgi:AcrR family transcriptional regulator